MSEINRKLIADKIAKNLINSHFDPAIRGEGEVLFSNKNIMLEQYKLLIDSSHRIETNRGTSNSLFIGINTILSSVLLHLSQLTTIEISHTPFVVSLILFGMLISLDWLRVIDSYKNLNFLNYSLVESFEQWLPTHVFSLRTKIEIEESNQKRKNIANILLISEKLLPKLFLSTYLLYFVTILIKIVTKLYL